MSTVPDVIGGKVAEGLRTYFTPQTWNRIGLLVDPAKYFFTGIPVYVNLVIRIKTVVLAVLDPIPDDFFPASIFVSCPLRANYKEVLLAYQTALNELLRSAAYDIQLPDSDAELLSMVDVASLVCTDDLKKATISFSLQLRTPSGIKVLRVEPVPIGTIYTGVDIARIWRDAKNPDKIHFREFL